MPLHDTKKLLTRIKDRNASIHVRIDKIALESCTPWHYSEPTGTIRTPTGSFFEISGLRRSDGVSQPIILQNEIGYLGIICKRFSG